jgi:hypothetical protein
MNTASIISRQGARKTHVNHGGEHSRSLRNLEHLEGRNVVYKLINIAIGSYVFVKHSCIRKLCEERLKSGTSH